jgi:hypothetical protein
VCLTFGIPIIAVTIDAAAPHLLGGHYRAPSSIGAANLVTMCLSGPIGEQYFCGPISDGSDRVDYEMARAYLARDHHSRFEIEAEIARFRNAADRLGADAVSRSSHSADCRLAIAPRRTDGRRDFRRTERLRPNANGLPASAAWLCWMARRVGNRAIFRAVSVPAVKNAVVAAWASYGLALFLSTLRA